MNKYCFYIDGDKDYQGTGEYVITAPHDSSIIGVVPEGNSYDLDVAVRAARHSFECGWNILSAQEKQKIFWKWAESIERRAEDIGRVASLEGGMAASSRIAGVKAYVEYIRYFAGFITKNYGTMLQTEQNFVNYVSHEPIGVAAVMPSWNTVVLGSLQKAVPALAAGNTVIIKAPDDAPLSTLMLAETIEEAAFPKGTINILCGNGSSFGRQFSLHQGIDVVSFTGSVPVGQSIMRDCAEGVKKVILELGGKTPMLLFPDADTEKAAAAVVQYAYAYQGQICTALSRLVVHESIKDEMIERILSGIRKLKPGYPGEDGVQIGPLFNRQCFERVEKYVEIGRRDGTLLCGGNRIRGAKFDRGYYYEPTVFLFQDDTSPICREEVFGPVLSIIPFISEEQAVSIVNGTEFGLSASIWSGDNLRVNRMVKRIQAGTVWANGFMQYSNHSPWGGMKKSGLGREYGIYALKDYIDYKNVWLNA